MRPAVLCFFVIARHLTPSVLQSLSPTILPDLPHLTDNFPVLSRPPPPSGGLLARGLRSDCFAHSSTLVNRCIPWLLRFEVCEWKKLRRDENVVAKKKTTEIHGVVRIVRRISPVHRSNALARSPPPVCDACKFKPALRCHDRIIIVYARALSEKGQFYHTSSHKNLPGVNTPV